MKLYRNLSTAVEASQKQKAPQSPPASMARWLCALFCVATLLCIVAYDAFVVRGGMRVFTPEQLFNRSGSAALHSKELDWLRSKTRQQESALSALSVREEREAAAVQASLDALLSRRSALEARKQRLQANESALRTEIDALERVKDKVRHLEEQKVRLQKQEETLAADRREFEAHRAQAKLAKEQFESQLKEFEKDQAAIAERVSGLQKDYSNLKLLEKDLREERELSDDEVEGKVDGKAIGAIIKGADGAIRRINSTALQAAVDGETMRAKLSKTLQMLHKLEEERAMHAGSGGGAAALGKSLVRASGGGGAADDGDLYAGVRVRRLLDDAALKEWHKCEKRSFVELVSDHACDLRWRQVLLGSGIARVHKVGPVRDYGAMYTTLESGDFAIFKPCYDSAFTASEPIAYHVDRMFGFYRVPALVSRSLSTSHVRGMLNGGNGGGKATAGKGAKQPSDVAQFDAVAEQCGSQHFLTGVMIGWTARNLIRLKTPFSVLFEEFMHGNLTDHRFMPMRLELVRYVMWSYLANDMLRIGDGRTFSFVQDQDLPRMHGGLFVFINNDQSAWLQKSGDEGLTNEHCKRKNNRITCTGLSDTIRTIAKNGTLDFESNARSPNAHKSAARMRNQIQRVYTGILAELCVFPHKIANRILSYNDTSRESRASFALAARLHEREVVEHDVHAWSAFDERVLWLRRRIGDCVQTHGLDNVIFRQKYPKEWLSVS